MNNIERFRNLFLEFETETKKKVDKDLSLDECVRELKNRRLNPYKNEDSFIDFCRRLRNIVSHNVNDNYYLITDDTINKLVKILKEVRHPYKVIDKATKNITSKKLNESVLKTMQEMNDKSYTHIPIYDNNKQLAGVFSENSLFQYIMSGNKFDINESTTFNDIKECIDLNMSKEIVKFVARGQLYDDVVNDFIYEFKNDNKLSCVMVTEHGKSTEYVQGIITAWDIIGR